MKPSSEDAEIPALGDILFIRSEAESGTAHPEDVRWLLEYYCDCVNSGAPVPHELLEFLRQGFERYLLGDKKLENALGLKGRRGRRRSESAEKRDRLVAAAVLRKRMESETLESAAEAVGELFHLSATQVRDAWAKNKGNALILLRVGRARDAYPWLPKEVERLNEIYGKEDWWVATRGKLEGKQAKN